MHGLTVPVLYFCAVLFAAKTGMITTIATLIMSLLRYVLIRNVLLLGMIKSKGCLSNCDSSEKALAFFYQIF